MKALILVDIQNDFVPGGALAVPDGDHIIPVVNNIQEKFDFVVATQDWHPSNHGSFAANHTNRKPGELIELNGLQQILWPVHCVQGSDGAELCKALNTSKVKKVFVKGTDQGIDSYSGFFDNGKKRSTGMGDYLKKMGINTVYVCGLATDYCVKFTALDAQSLGFKTFVIEDACRGVNLSASDSSLALDEMRKSGVHVIKSVNL